MEDQEEADQVVEAQEAEGRFGAEVAVEQGQSPNHRGVLDLTTNGWLRRSELPWSEFVLKG